MRFLKLLVTFAALCWGLPFSHAHGNVGGANFVIEAVTIVDTVGTTNQPDMRVTVRGGRIEAVQPMLANSKPDANATVIDGKGKFLMPGLWDAHVHLVDMGEATIPLLLAYGITSVRDMGGDIEKLRAWRARIENGSLTGPRIKFCGPMLEGRLTAGMAGRTDHWAVETPVEAKAVIERLAKAGVDCVKMRTFASPETYLALAAAAKAKGLPLFGHAPWGVEPSTVLDAGQTSFEHAFYPWPWKSMSAVDKAAITNRMRANGIFLTPTLIAWETFRLDQEFITAMVDDSAPVRDPRQKQVSVSLRKNWLSGLKDVLVRKPGTAGWGGALDEVCDQISEMRAGGVGVLAGSDTGATMIFPGSSLHQELKLLVNNCRLTPRDALRAATVMPAKALKLDGQTGAVAKGMLADLVLLDQDPAAEITNALMITGVMANGRWFDRAALDKIIRTAEEEMSRR